MKSYAVAALIAAVTLSGCTRTTPGELMQKADDARRMQNFPLAIEFYTKVVEDHEGAPEAETASFLIATVYNNEIRDHGKAVEAYKAYLEAYPQGNQAPMALFLVGYLYNNELRNLDSAAVAYRLFLERYPGHEMAPSARFELENLGKSPEELLPTDTTGASGATAGVAGKAR